MKSLKVFLITLLIAFLFIHATNVVFATENNQFNFESDNTSTGSSNTNAANAANTQNQGNVYSITDSGINNATNNATNNTTNNTNNANTSVYNNTDLPNAGSSDGVIIVAIIAVFGISALYAYKKIREYNI